MAEKNTPYSSTYNDVVDETADGVKAASANAEQILLNRMLGINFADTSQNIAIAVVQRIQNVRGAVEGNLQNILQRDIDAAIQSISGRPNNPSFPQNLQRVHAIAEAVWKTVPKEISNDLVFFNDMLPANPNLPIAGGRYRHVLRDLVRMGPPPPIVAAGPRPLPLYQVSVDLASTFWREAGPFENEDSLVAALTNQSLERAGIAAQLPIPPGSPLGAPRTALPVSHSLTEFEARAIVQQRLPAINGSGVQNLFEIQKELRARHSNHRRLLDGSDNEHGAALAAAILMQHRDAEIQGVLGGGRSQPEVQVDMRRSQNRVHLQKSITDLKAAPVQATLAWSDVRAILASYSTLRGTVATAAAGTVFRCGPETLTLRGTTPAERNRIHDWLDDLNTKASKEDLKYIQYSHNLAEIQRITRELGGSFSLLDSYVQYDPVTRAENPQHVNFVLSVNINGILDQLLSDPTLELDRKHDEDIARLQKELDDVRNGRTTGLTGAAAQHAVMCKYFEVKHRLSPTQAAQAANYVRGRSQVDAELSQLGRDISDDMYEDDRTFMERRWDILKDSMSLVSQDRLALNIVSSVARSNGIRLRDWGWDRQQDLMQNARRNVDMTERLQPQWSNANHRQLISSYFALKKLYEGNGPKDLKLAKSQYVQSQMRLITQAILNKHALRALQDFGPMLGISNQEMQDKLKEMSKTEIATMLDEFLHGEEPDAYKARVQQSINYADKHASWAQRQLSRGVRGTAGYMGNKAVAIRKGIGGGVGATAKGIGRAGKAVVYDAPKAVVKGVWNNKGSIATVTALSLLGGPIAGIGAWYAMKQFGGNKSQAA